MRISAYIAASLVALTALACSTSPIVIGRQPTTVTPAPTPAPAPTTTSASVGEEIVARTNDERRRLGLSTLRRSAALMQAAQIQADQMAATGTMAHEIPGTRYPTLGARLAAVSYSARAAGENIAEGYADAATAVAGWMTSPGHRANITSRDFTEMGAAMSRSPRGARYYVQVFGAPL
jgi:uncharacterized protein YkwD